MLHHGQKISQHLGGVVLVGQAVPYRYAGELGQGLDAELQVEQGERFGQELENDRPVLDLRPDATRPGARR